MDKKTNIALHRKVLAQGINVSALTDGICDRSVRWESGSLPADAVIDLGCLCEISEIVVHTYFDGRRWYKFEVWAGLTAKKMEKVAEQKENEVAPEEGYDLTFPPVKARFVILRVLEHSIDSCAHVSEIEIMGTALGPYSETNQNVSSDPADIAFGKSVHAGFGRESASAVTDGNPESFWLAAYCPAYVDIDFEKNYELQKVTLTAPSIASFSYRLYGSMDGVNFGRIGNIRTTPQKPTATLEIQDTVCRILRVLCLSNSQGRKKAAMLSGVSAFGKPSELPVQPTRQTLSFTDYDAWRKAYEQQTLSEEETLIAEMRGLVSRVLGEKYVPLFEFRILPDCQEDTYCISDLPGHRILIEGNCGVSMAVGLNHYLKYYCHVQVAEQTMQNRMPSILPAVKKAVKVSTPYKVRYAYNYCTLSYTLPFYGFNRWQRELDYLLMSGVNLVLDLNGQEAVWLTFLKQFGYTVDEAKDFIVGYTYKAWWLMGNMTGYGGPVADAWLYDTLELARRNQRYLKIMGASPALQMFVGALPEDFAEKAGPKMKALGFSSLEKAMVPQGLWSDAFVRPNIVRTSYDGFGFLADTYYTIQRQLLGDVSHDYCGDVCHEGGIFPEGLSKETMAKTILSEVLRFDPKATWILQAWMENPRAEVLEGLKSLGREHVLILDLSAVARPNWTNETTWKSPEFGGMPWVYSILDNYGGRTGAHGQLKTMAENMAGLRTSARAIKGIGITPEGTNQNPVVYDLFFEMAWRTKAPQLGTWLREYCLRRYGRALPHAMKAWEVFAATNYAVDVSSGGTKGNVVNETASFQIGAYEYADYKAPYRRDRFEEGVRLFMEDAPELLRSEGGVYDMVDLLRTVLFLACDDLYAVLKRSLLAEEPETFRHYSVPFLEAMKLLETLSCFSRDERLGNFIGEGLDFASDERTGDYADFDLDMMQYNAKILLTAWASAPLMDYANRQYDGLMHDYYYPMWSRLIRQVNADLTAGRKPRRLLRKDGFLFAWEFVIQEKKYPRKVRSPRGLMDVYTQMAPFFGTSAALNREKKRLKRKLQKMKIFFDEQEKTAAFALIE